MYHHIINNSYNIKKTMKGRYDMNNNYRNFPNYWWNKPPTIPENCWEKCIDLRDHGPNPYVVNIEEATKQNFTFRTALWTGTHLQLTVMSINPGEDIGLEIHYDIDQFIRIEEGQGIVLMGDSKNNLYFRRKVYDDYVIFIPAGHWHNVINVGCVPLKLYSIYAPPAHPHGTIHKTKEEAEMHNDY